MTRLWRLHTAEELAEVSVPSDPETVFPASEYGIPRFELEVGFLFAAPEAGGAHVADVVGEVGVQGTDFQGHV